MENRLICFLQCLLVFLVAVNGQNDVSIPELLPVKICEESATFREACNICQCNRDGTRKFCTQLKCSAWGVLWSKLRGNDGSGCEPSKDYKVGCHLCTCDADGYGIVCPDEPCPVAGIILKKYLKYRKS